jgi:hypothetical protein
VLNIAQHSSFEILLAAEGALFAGNIIDDKKFVVVPVNILNAFFLHLFVSTKIAFFHLSLAHKAF